MLQFMKFKFHGPDWRMHALLVLCTDVDTMGTGACFDVGMKLHEIQELGESYTLYEVEDHVVYGQGVVVGLLAVRLRVDFCVFVRRKRAFDTRRVHGEIGLKSGLMIRFDDDLILLFDQDDVVPI